MAAARAGVGPPIRAAASRHSRGDAPQHARRVCHRQQHVWGADGTDDEPRSMAQSPGLRPIRPRRHRRISALDGMGTGDAAGPTPTTCGPQPRPPRSPKRPSRTRSRKRAERPARVGRAGQARPATRQAYQGASDDAGSIFPTTKPRVTTISILWGLLGGVEEKNRGSFKPRGPFRTHLARNAWFPIFSPLRPFTHPDI